MNKVSRIARVKNPKGLHLRPAGLLAQLAGGFASQIELSKDNVQVDARSILDLLTLVATHGSAITVTAQGDDAEAAVDSIVSFIESDETQEAVEEADRDV